MAPTWANCLMVSRALPRTSESGAEQCGRDHGNPVLTAVCLRIGMDDERVDQVVADVLPQPQQVLLVILLHGTTQLHFDGNQALVGPLDDQVDLLPTPFGPRARSPAAPASVRRVRYRPGVEGTNPSCLDCSPRCPHKKGRCSSSTVVTLLFRQLYRYHFARSTLLLGVAIALVLADGVIHRLLGQAVLRARRRRRANRL